VNLANELCKITFSKFSVKYFLAKPLSDHSSDLTTHLQQMLQDIMQVQREERTNGAGGRKFCQEKKC